MRRKNRRIIQEVYSQATKEGRDVKVEDFVSLVRDKKLTAISLVEALIESYNDCVELEARLFLCRGYIEKVVLGKVSSKDTPEDRSLDKLFTEE